MAVACLLVRTELLYMRDSGLGVAQDVDAVKEARVTHLLNLARSACNCADQLEQHDADNQEFSMLQSERVTIFGIKGEPYGDLFRRILVSLWENLAMMQ